MLTIKEITRIRWVMLVVAVALASYYFLVFRPLSHRAEALEGPLAEVWEDLMNVNVASSGVHELDLSLIKKTREKLQASLFATEKASEMIAARVELEPEIRDRLKQSFSLSEFEIESGKRRDQVILLAKTQQVTLAAAALAGFPEQHKAEMEERKLLWAQLSVVHHILTAAINSKVTTVKNISVLPIQPQRAAGGAAAYWEEISVRIELVAPMESAANFLLTLPLRPDEIKAAGLPESVAGKPALFLDRLIVRKQSPEKPAEVNLDLVVCGFVRRT